MKFPWRATLRRLLLTVLFCLAIAAMVHSGRPDQAFVPVLVYSLCIGTWSWALIDLGRHLLVFDEHPEWPVGLKGLAFAAFGISAGYVLGTLSANAMFGNSSFVWRERALAPRSLLGSALAGIVITYYFFSKAKSAHLQARVMQARHQAAQAQLKLLQAQLSPHMLFNTLANLRVLIGSDAQRAQDMLDHLIAYLRATLSASRATQHSLQAEFDRLRDYLELMTVRMGPRLHYSLSLPPELAALPVPTLLLQPLVENAIQHGLEPQTKGGSIAVSAQRCADRLTLEVVDTGVGITPIAHAPDQPTGFGIVQVRERLATRFEQQATINLAANYPTGVRVSIIFPCQPSDL